MLTGTAPACSHYEGGGKNETKPDGSKARFWYSISGSVPSDAKTGAEEIEAYKTGTTNNIILAGIMWLMRNLAKGRGTYNLDYGGCSRSKDSTGTFGNLNGKKV